MLAFRRKFQSNFTPSFISTICKKTLSLSCQANEKSHKERQLAIRANTCTQKKKKGADKLICQKSM